MPPETSAGKGATSIGPVAVRKPDGSMHVRIDRPRPTPAYTNGHAQEVTPEFVDRTPKLSVETVVPFYQVAAARTAVGVDSANRERYRRRPISERLREQFEVDLDVRATPALEANIHQAPFVSNVVRIERAKELWKYGRQLPNIEGPYGFGELIAIQDRRLLDGAGFLALGRANLVLDPIERTKEASRPSYALEEARRGKGSTVQIAGAVNQELGEMPTEEQGAYYADGITVGPRVAEFIRSHDAQGLLDRPTKELIRLILEAHRSNDPRIITAVVLSRERNARKMAELEALGVNVQAIPDGDLTHMLDVATLHDSRKPKIVVGSGGKEEGAAGAFGLKTQRAYAERKYVGKQGELVPGISRTLTIDQVAPGNPDSYFVVFASINGVPELGMDGVTRAMIQRPHDPEPRSTRGSDYRVQVGSVTSRDRHIRKDLIPVTRNRLHH
ncbi:MAG: fructose-bisphosphatase class II [Candidatus Levybacteria bacterium]|nr:fructose-bisphosphatase class II [Candidatus Levybacteria bacterium]